jgi:hypothetical protein
MTTAFNTRPSLIAFSEGLTFVVMVGLTLASAATFAFAPTRSASADVPRLPTVVVSKVSASEIVRLPIVIVTGKRSG